MSILGWIVLGLIAGFIASKIVNRQGEGFFVDIILGIVGGLVGGWLFERFGETGITGFNIWSMFVAVVGAIVLLVAYHPIRRQPHRPPSRPRSSDPKLGLIGGCSFPARRARRCDAMRGSPPGSRARL